MIRGLFRFLFSLVIIALIISLLTAFWLVYDGRTDTEHRGEVALVPGHEEVETSVPGPLIQARLDKAIELYQGNVVTHIMVSGTGKMSGFDEAGMMEKYLEDHGIPSSAIIKNNEGIPTKDIEGADTQEIAHKWARVLKRDGQDSVMLVTQYYQMTRWKMALKQQGMALVDQTHVGAFSKSDIDDVAYEVAALYTYLGESYLFPAAKKVSEDAKVEGEKAKESINHGLDSLPK